MINIDDMRGMMDGAFAAMIAERRHWNDANLEQLRVAFELDVATLHRSGGPALSIAFARGRIAMIDAEQRRRTDG